MPFSVTVLITLCFYEFLDSYKGRPYVEILFFQILELRMSLKYQSISIISYKLPISIRLSVRHTCIAMSSGLLNVQVRTYIS